MTISRSLFWYKIAFNANRRFSEHLAQPPVVGNCIPRPQKFFIRQFLKETINGRSWKSYYFPFSQSNISDWIRDILYPMHGYFYSYKTKDLCRDLYLPKVYLQQTKGIRITFHSWMKNNHCICYASNKHSLCCFKFINAYFYNY